MAGFCRSLSRLALSSFQGARVYGVLSCSTFVKLSTKMALPRCYFDMTADGEPVGRIIFEVSQNISCQDLKITVKI